MKAITLTWHRFPSMTSARGAFSTTSCVYAQADPKGHVVRVGKASKGLTPRYRGGTGWALDAAMHGSGNLVFVAAVDEDIVEAVEATLIWEHRDQLVYNNVGKKTEPEVLVEVEHRGEVPRFE